MSVKVVNMYTKVVTGMAVNTTSKASGSWETDLSPFHLGPCDLYAVSPTTPPMVARNMENAWQYSKVYASMADATGNPTQAYWPWAWQGWANPAAVRYPMGRGAKPLYSLWAGAKLGYIDARKAIYGPLYAEAVQKTAGWARLQQLYNQGVDLVLRDYDGYDHQALNMTLTDVLNNPAKKMGHAFVLAMLLTGDAALNQMALRI